MNLKKVLCVIMAAVMLFALTACKSSKASQLTIKINGLPVTSPFTVEQLGDGYSVFNYREDSDGKISGDIIYRNIITLKTEFVAQVLFDENVTDSEHIKQKIKALYGRHNWFSVNGITVASSKSEVQETFGEPTGKRKVNDDTIEQWFYCEDGKQEDDYYLRISFDEDDTVYVIGVRLE